MSVPNDRPSALCSDTRPKNRSGTCLVPYEDKSPASPRSPRQKSSGLPSSNYTPSIYTFHDDFWLRMSLTDELKFTEALQNNFKPTFVTNYFNKTAKTTGMSNSEEFKAITKNLSPSGQLILSEPNAGGNSVFSEVLSFEILHRAFGASLLKTEMQIDYFYENSKKTDYSVMLNGKTIGVSVTRAFHFMGDDHFTDVDARILLRKKLNGVICSTDCVTERDSWEKQILHCFVRSERVAQILRQEYRKMKSHLRSNTIVLVTVVPDVSCIFFEKSCDH